MSLGTFRRKAAAARPALAGTLLAATLLATALPVRAQGMAGEGEAPAVAEQPLSPAERSALAATGKTLAREHCQRCHAIDDDAASTNTNAPPLRDVAKQWPAEDLEEALAEGIVTGHEDMPEFVFTTDEIIAFIEFLHTLGNR